ncbi:MAG: zinc-dependent alcohol dehydrogenase family protein [Thermoanaerobaculia bacterium]
MRVMLLEEAGRSLRPVDRDLPVPGPREVLLRVRACGVCRTDLHVCDGELNEPALPLVLGHEIVGEVARVGEEVADLAVGQRLGVPWLGATCGRCRFCRDGAENLCDQPSFTGYTRDGGYADYTLADPRFCLPLPDGYGDVEAAPLLCAGLIGYRAYRIAADAERLGLYGFGAAAHILAQIARHEGREVYAFTRPGDTDSQRFARELGAVWAGGSDETAPVELDAAILFAPVGALVPAALAAVRKGGLVVCAGIHMSDIPSFPYELLWGERVVRSVANLTREDGVELFHVAPRVPVRTSVRTFPLEQANEALAALREGRLQGAAVLVT